jgi:S-adenosylmethionine:tRNA ribosyltransferase-isomerase
LQYHARVQRSDFAYDLPPDLIAQTPLPERSASRLLVLAGNRPTASPAMPKATLPLQDPGLRREPRPAELLRDCTMRDFPELLRPGDLLVFNDTRVVAARLSATKPSGGRVEIFLERAGDAEGTVGPTEAKSVGEALRAKEAPRLYAAPRYARGADQGQGSSDLRSHEALVQLRASKPIRAGLEVTTAGGSVRVLGREGDLWKVAFPGPALEFFEQWGQVPLPPYIQRAADASDRERYQSIFARERGAVAAPTASLHFDAQLIKEIEARGVKRAFITLHVGAGTFQPVRTDDLASHVMHAERVSVGAETWKAIQETRAAGGRVIAIGTTVVRALESAALAMQATATENEATPTAAMTSTAAARAPQPRLGRHPSTCWAGETRLFIRPGFNFQVTDALLTNFHLPESTLLMLVCAFAGKQQVLAAYEHAVRARYRFFSYGDAMFVTKARMEG